MLIEPLLICVICEICGSFSRLLGLTVNDLRFIDLLFLKVDGNQVHDRVQTVNSPCSEIVNFSAAMAV
jgi:hypothetical protein